MYLLYDPAIPLEGIYLKECESGYNKGTCLPMFITALFIKQKLWKQPRCPTTEEWIKKIKEEGNFVICRLADKIGEYHF
jgi:hypothetical protein